MSLEETVYQNYVPTNGAVEGTKQDFDKLKLSFENATSNGKKPFVNSQPPIQLQSPPLQPSIIGAYGETYPGNGVGPASGNFNGNYNGASAMPFIPQSQQHQHPNSNNSNPQGPYSGPTSPYLGVATLNQIPFGSPSSQNGILPISGQPSYNGSAYSGQMETMPPSPNPYAQNPYGNYGPIDYASQGMMGMIPGVGSPTLGGQMQGGVAYGMQFPMIGQSGTAMIGAGQTVSV